MTTEAPLLNANERASVANADSCFAPRRSPKNTLGAEDRYRSMLPIESPCTPLRSLIDGGGASSVRSVNLNRCVDGWKGCVRQTAAGPRPSRRNWNRWSAKASRGESAAGDAYSKVAEHGQAMRRRFHAVLFLIQ